MKGDKFDFFEVTADIGVRVWGKDTNEIFENSAVAITRLMINPNSIEKKIEKELVVRGNDLPSLLINWLTELLVIRDSEGILFSSFEVKVSNDEKSLIARVVGNHFIGDNLEMDIKAITYSLFKLEKNKEHYFLQFVLDV
jgi:SHS2 domain-containing protein